MEPSLLYVDAVTIPVPDLDRGLAFYRDVLGHQLVWRNEATGQAALHMPESDTEIVLTTRQGYGPDWKVASAEAAAKVFEANGGKVLAGPMNIPIGWLAIVEDPFGNRLVLLDSTKAPMTRTTRARSPAFLDHAVSLGRAVSHLVLVVLCLPYRRRILASWCRSPSR